MLHCGTAVAVAVGVTVATDVAVTVGGITVPPYKMLITLLGYQRDEIAELVASHCIYQTVEVPDNGGVLRYLSDNMAGGAYEVFYKNFDFIDYKVVIDYRYDSRLILKSVKVFVTFKA